MVGWTSGLSRFNALKAECLQVGTINKGFDQARIVTARIEDGPLALRITRRSDSVALGKLYVHERSEIGIWPRRAE